MANSTPPKTNENRLYHLCVVQVVFFTCSNLMIIMLSKFFHVESPGITLLNLIYNISTVAMVLYCPTFRFERLPMKTYIKATFVAPIWLAMTLFPSLR